MGVSKDHTVKVSVACFGKLQTGERAKLCLRVGKGMNEKYSDFLYVLWVKTGREEIAFKQIQTLFGDSITWLNLLVETFFRKQGKVLKITKPAFPGYIFLTTEIENNEFIFRARECARQSLSILKPLCYTGTFQAAMREDERAIIDRLWQGKNCIEASTGFFKGDYVVITDGPFIGQESIIKEIHPRKLQAIIEIEMMGRTISIQIGLEIIRKLP